MSRRWSVRGGSRLRWVTALLAVMLGGGLVVRPVALGAQRGTPGPGQGVSAPRAPGTPTRPNVLILVSDDQTQVTFSRQLMPTVFSRLVDEGVQFTRAYVNTSLCCPSRSQILTGLYEHHTGVDLNTTRLKRPTFLEAVHEAGYRTSITGKYLNSSSCNPRAELDQFVCYKSDWGQLYKNPTLEVNGVRTTEEGYTTDILAQYTSDFIQSIPADQPFFAMYTPISPHLPAIDSRCRDNPVDPYRPPSFDEDTMNDGKPAYMQRGPLLPAEIALADQNHQRMTQAVECLDPAIGTILDSLGSREADTIVFYLSDNGFLYGEHRFQGKEVPYEEASRVPFVVRYPALIPESQPFVSDALVENTDIVATIAELVGIPWHADGLSLVPILSQQSATVRDSLLVEGCEGINYPCTTALPQEEGDIYVPSYFGLETAQYSFIEYQTGERELYDLDADPYQLTNLVFDPHYQQVENDLADQLVTLEAPPPVDTTIVTGPTGPVQPGPATFVYFAQSRLATYQCKILGLNGGNGWHKCGYQTARFSVTQDGSYEFQVRARDEFGNVDATPAERSFSVDTTGPVVRFDQAPHDPTNQTTATFVFHANEALTSATCQLDALPTVDCTNGQFSASSLAEGPHSLSVVATDLVGNQSTTPYPWTVDLTAPTVTVTGGPATFTNRTDATFTFTSDDGTATFQCLVDHGGNQPCQSGVTYQGIQEGKHQFRVIAADAAGNVSTPGTWQWTVDRTAPIAGVISGPSSPTNQTTAVFAIGSNDPDATLSCSLDGGTAATCTSPFTYTDLAEGPHQFSLTATDRAGNTSAPATWAWTVDVTAPVTTIDTGPANPTSETTATFTFHADESQATFQCVLDRVGPVACVSGVTYTGLSPGNHEFDVFATDQAGNVGQAAVWQWQITGFSGPHRRA